MRTLPPPATPTSKSARNYDYGSDSSSTFGVGTVGLQPLTHEGCSSATQSPSVCVDRQRQNAWQLARLNRQPGDRLAECRRDLARGRRRAPSAMS